ncbi:transposase [Nonomuraea sp. PA05]|uniref:transposase n=1 Tax=Nonomuraea sp. PA05 TaxID=2604466 RepID=UPI0011D7A4B3|nr:transposase [Nonomuraea sp. PA05]
MRPCRHPSDTSAAQWALLERLLPVPACQTPTGGRPGKHDRRDVVDAIRYLVANGCAWRAIRLRRGRCPGAVTLIVDPQSVKGAETVSEATRDLDPPQHP